MCPAIFDDVAKAASEARMITRRTGNARESAMHAFSLSVKRINKYRYELGHRGRKPLGEKISQRRDAHQNPSPRVKDQLESRCILLGCDHAKPLVHQDHQRERCEQGCAPCEQS